MIIPVNQRQPITIASLAADFAALGVSSGMTLIVHSSMKSLGGWVNGGPAAIVLALEQVIGEQGTLVMPTHSNDLSDPSGWQNPPIPESWWQTVIDTMPAYDPALTPLWHMGVIPDTFRKQNGVQRSAHPQLSFAAWGKHAEHITAEHPNKNGLGETSPLARLYELNGNVLLLGVGHDRNTSIHLAEYRSDYAGKKLMRQSAPVLVKGRREWTTFTEVDTDSDDFAALGADFERETGLIRRGKIAAADAMLMPQPPLVDYAAAWLMKNRRG